MDRSHTFLSTMARHAVRVSLNGVCSCGIGCSRCIRLHGRHERRRLHTCRGRRGVVTSARRFVRQFHCGTAGTVRIRDHVGRLRGLSELRISRRSGDYLRLGFPPTPRSNILPISVSKLARTCNSRIILRGITTRVRHNSGITFINGGNRNGSALIGYVVGRVRCDNRVQLKRNIGVNCFTRGRTSLLSRGLAMFRAVSCITINSVHAGVQSVLNTFVFNNRTSSGGITILSNNRHDHLTVVGLLLRPIGLLVLSRPAGRLSVHSGSILGRTVGTFSNAIVIIDRSHSFLSNLISGVCRFSGGGVALRLKKVGSFLRGGHVSSLTRVRQGARITTRGHRMAISSGGLRCRRHGRFSHRLGGLRHRMRRTRTSVTGLRSSLTRVRNRFTRNGASSRVVGHCSTSGHTLRRGVCR